MRGDHAYFRVPLPARSRGRPSCPGACGTGGPGYKGKVLPRLWYWCLPGPFGEGSCWQSPSLSHQRSHYCPFDEPEELGFPVAGDVAQIPGDGVPFFPPERLIPETVNGTVNEAVPFFNSSILQRHDQLPCSIEEFVQLCNTLDARIVHVDLHTPTGYTVRAFLC